MITASARISTYMSMYVSTFGRFLGEINSEYHYLDALHIYSWLNTYCISLQRIQMVVRTID